ncbi:MAG: hypothetical protein IKA17_04485 [Clostridia bacterium]|nr:hypothetical protein [Clostridia bacterium]
MTINKAIERAMRLHPDTFTDEQKSEWISELDGKIALETMHLPQFKKYEFPDSGETELLAKAPYDNIYELYIIAMGDFHSGETASYAVSAAMFMRAYEEFRKNYIRTHIPPQCEIRI